MDGGLMPPTLLHIILQSRALALSAFSAFLQAVAGHVQAGGQPGRFVHQRGALREGREPGRGANTIQGLSSCLLVSLDSVAQPPGFCLVISRAGILLTRRVTWLLPRLDQLIGAPQSLVENIGFWILEPGGKK